MLDFFIHQTVHSSFLAHLGQCIFPLLLFSEFGPSSLLFYFGNFCRMMRAAALIPHGHARSPPLFMAAGTILAS